MYMRYYSMALCIAMGSVSISLMGAPVVGAPQADDDIYSLTVIEYYESYNYDPEMDSESYDFDSDDVDDDGNDDNDDAMENNSKEDDITSIDTDDIDDSPL